MTFYFIVNATATLNGTDTYNCKTGVINSNKDYKPNEVKKFIRDNFSNKFKTKNVAVVIGEVVSVNEETYQKEIPNFLGFK